MSQLHRAPVLSSSEDDDEDLDPHGWYDDPPPYSSLHAAAPSSSSSSSAAALPLGRTGRAKRKSAGTGHIPCRVQGCMVMFNTADAMIRHAKRQHIMDHLQLPAPSSSPPSSSSSSQPFPSAMKEEDDSYGQGGLSYDSGDEQYQ